VEKIIIISKQQSMEAVKELTISENEENCVEKSDAGMSIVHSLRLSGN
jgi:hypothetical protein